MDVTENIGRIRLRNPILKDGEIADKFLEYLKPFQGVLNVKNSVRVGSVLIVFNADETSIKKIEAHILGYKDQDCSNWIKPKQPAKRKPQNRTMKKIVKMGLIGGVVGTLGALAVSERLHIMAGTVFLSLASVHIFQNRKTLFK